jgi:hypothetical protein
LKIENQTGEVNLTGRKSDLSREKSGSGGKLRVGKKSQRVGKNPDWGRCGKKSQTGEVRKEVSLGKCAKKSEGYDTRATILLT